MGINQNSKHNDKGNDLESVLFFLLSLSSEYIFEILNDTDAVCKKYKLEDIPPIEHWFSFYDDVDILYSFLFNQVENEKEIINFKEFFPNVDIESYTKFLNSKNESLDLGNTVSKFCSKQEEPREKNYYLRFVLRIVIPSLYFFGEFPQDLFHKAKSGDIEALCNLLLIDKSILAEESIKKIYFQAGQVIDSPIVFKIAEALKGEGKIKTIRKAKSMIAAYISEASKAFGKSLTSSQIYNLFTMSAKLKNPDDVQDNDLIMTPDGFSKAIDRNAETYKKLFFNDKIK